MKKSFFVFSLYFVMSFLVAPSSFATSGACSSHGGVSCSSGADLDGSVICNDGWLNSSVSYSSMVSCNAYNPVTPLPVSIPTPPPIVIPSPSPVSKPAPAPLPAPTPVPVSTSPTQILISQPVANPVVTPKPVSMAPIDETSEPESFSDVNNSTPFGTSIKLLKTKNILSGYEDGTFRPLKTLNRAELIKIIVGAKYPTIEETYNQNCFADVQKDQWYTKSICFAKAQNFVAGYSDNTFKPQQEVNYAETLKITLEVFNLKPAEKTAIWYKAYLDQAKMKNIDVEGSLPTESLSRAKAAEVIVRVLQQM